MLLLFEVCFALGCGWVVGLLVCLVCELVFYRSVGLDCCLDWLVGGCVDGVWLRVLSGCVWFQFGVCFAVCGIFVCD